MKSVLLEAELPLVEVGGCTCCSHSLALPASQFSVFMPTDVSGAKVLEGGDYFLFKGVLAMILLEDFVNFLLVLDCNSSSGELFRLLLRCSRKPLRVSSCVSWAAGAGVFFGFGFPLRALACRTRRSSRRLIN